ncbi:hypothetical protein GGQ86_004090 [Xanthobacter flavus]|uniref:Uncharacterized protein n=1 Tax=Xanthobacter flavus TaxID=281 RepID=A0A9W6CSV1_XANFL|nr:hypothetical protein [Xanthobacter flavus]GLI24729.1 hypothetical protein XFLAVUS301_44030 [Xanthobacter flavus]
MRLDAWEARYWHACDTILHQMGSSLEQWLGAADAKPLHQINGILNSNLRTIYAEAVGEMRLSYGAWVIFDHCMPFNISRAYDEAQGIETPRIWTAERDLEMWKALGG